MSDSSVSPVVGVVMGSISDWDTMRGTATVLESLGLPYEKRALSAHRTPDALAEWVQSAEARGVKVFIAAAGGAAHLAGVVASLTLRPVLGVPIESKSLKGLDSLLSIVQMPAGIPVMTLAIGSAGAKNAALSAAAIIALQDEAVHQRLVAFREEQTAKVLAAEFPE